MLPWQRDSFYHSGQASGLAKRPHLVDGKIRLQYFSQWALRGLRRTLAGFLVFGRLECPFGFRQQFLRLAA